MPKKAFPKRSDSTAKAIAGDGYQIIVCLDTNENIYNNSIGKKLTDREGISILEVVVGFTCPKVGATYFCGSTPMKRV